MREKTLADVLFRYTKEHCEREDWLDLGIPSTLASWFIMSIIHIWMLLFRLRNLSDKSSETHIKKQIIDSLFFDLERGIVIVGKSSNPFFVGKNNKLFLKSYYGIMAALDESFFQGDAELADCIYRNLYQLNTDTVTAEAVEAMVIYIRKNLYKFDNLPDEFFTKNMWRWEEPPILTKSNRRPKNTPLFQLYSIKPNKMQTIGQGIPLPLEVQKKLLPLDE